MTQAKYGTYAFDSGQLYVNPHLELVQNEGGQYVKTRQQMQVSGYYLCNGEVDASLKMNALINALSVPGKDFVVYHTNGTPSSMKLMNGPSLTGVRMVGDLTFPKRSGADHVTQRYFEFTLEAEYRYPGSLGLLQAFHETLSFSGGGPRIIWKENMEEPAQKQVPCLFTVCTVIQSGIIVGIGGYPPLPKMAFPQYLSKEVDYNPETPQRRGQGYELYKYTYRYEFKAPFRLTGVPNLWIS